MSGKVSKPRILIGSESFSLERGGAARVGRLVAGYFSDARQEARLVAVSDQVAIADFGLPSVTAAGRRPSFVWECWRSSLTCSHFIYNHIGVARAHCRLPFLKRPFAIWLLGIEAWGDRMAGDYGRVTREANLPLSISEFTRRRAAEVEPSAGAAEVCWLASEEDALPERSPSFDGPPTVLILSRIDISEMQKGHVELIEAWPAVVSAVPDARLLIAGGGNGLDTLRGLAAASQARANIEFTGFLPQAGIEDLWLQAHVFAMPSRQEGFGLVYIEAMRYGLPVIASVHDAGQEVNAHGTSGLNADLDRPGDLAAHVIALLRDRALARTMGQAGQARWREHFCRSAFNRRFAPIMQLFLAG